MRAKSLLICNFAVFISIAGLSSAASANGRFPSTVSIKPRRGSSSEILSSTTFGVIVSRDSGSSWQWICEESMGYGGAIDPAFVWLENNTILGTTWRDLIISRDGGCSWEAHAFFVQLGSTDVAAHPTNPSLIYVTTGRGSATNKLYRSTNGGDVFEATTLSKDNILLSNVRFAPSNPTRLYVSGYMIDGRDGYLYRSDDNGENWTEMLQSVSVGSTYHVLGVNPAADSVVFTRASGMPTNHLLRSEDSGASFTTALKIDEDLRDIAFSADGQTVWVSSLTSIYKSTNGGVSFEKLSPSPDQNACVTRSGSTLYACGWPFSDGWAVAKSADEGATWTKLFTLNELKGPLECSAGTSTHDLCGPRWPQIAALLGIDTSDGGSGDGGSADAGTTTPPAMSGCGCATGGTGAVGAFLLALGLLVVWRRRNHRTPRGVRTAGENGR